MINIMINKLSYCILPYDVYSLYNIIRGLSLAGHVVSYRSTWIESVNMITIQMSPIWPHIKQETIPYNRRLVWEELQGGLYLQSNSVADYVIQ